MNKYVGLLSAAVFAVLPFSSVVAQNANANVQTVIEEVFGEDHIMVSVAKCESDFRQYTPTGDTFMGGWNGQMIGAFQLNEAWHREAAEDLGYDITDIRGNAEYAKYLYEQEGLRPWSSSSVCWNEEHFGDTSDDVGTVTKDLVIGVYDAEVMELQRILNENGYILTDEGPGSPGNETIYFGLLTQERVQELQCDHDIVCGGSAYTTGWGMVGKETRDVLRELDGFENIEDEEEDVESNEELRVQLMLQLIELLKQLLVLKSQQ